MNLQGLATVFIALVALGFLIDLWLRLRRYLTPKPQNVVVALGGAAPIPVPAAVANLPAAPVEELCKNCKHWNHADGQALMRENMAFFEASKHVSPARMVTKYQDGEVVVPSNVPPRCEWKDFGACHAFGEGTWHEHSCKDDKRGNKFELKVVA